MTRPLMVLVLAALAGCETEPVREVQKPFQPTKAQQPPEEADHPMWGGVFRSVKAGR